MQARGPRACASCGRSAVVGVMEIHPGIRTRGSAVGLEQAQTRRGLGTWYSSRFSFLHKARSRWRGRGGMGKWGSRPRVEKVWGAGVGPCPGSAVQLLCRLWRWRTVPSTLSRQGQWPA